MYHKYQTDAIVLNRYDSGEADRTITLYTHDFGLIRAKATSIRAEKSKMRYALQSYSYAQVSLIRGKVGWRLAGASPYSGIQSSSIKSMAVMARVSDLLNRLIVGEERNEYLFNVLASAHQTLTICSLEIIATVEVVLMARILFSLGYISAEAHETTLFTHTAYQPQHVQEASFIQGDLLVSVNQALSLTHL